MSTPPGFAVDVHHERHDVVVVAVSGEIDIATAPVLWSRTQQAMADGATKLVIDLSKTTFMDSTGLAIIIRASGIYGASSVVVRSPQPRVYALFEITGLLGRLNVIQADGPAEDQGSDPISPSAPDVPGA